VRPQSSHKGNTSGERPRIDTFILTARLPPEIGAVVRKAIEAAVEALREPANVPAETPLQIPANVRCADALRLVAETFLAHRGEETGAGSSADRCQVVVHIDQAILAEGHAAEESEPHRCELDDGPALALDTARRLALLPRASRETLGQRWRDEAR
jgi:hypothetical protein